MAWKPLPPFGLTEGHLILIKMFRLFFVVGQPLCITGNWGHSHSTAFLLAFSFCQSPLRVCLELWWTNNLLLVLSAASELAQQFHVQLKLSGPIGNILNVFFHSTETPVLPPRQAQCCVWDEAGYRMLCCCWWLVGGALEKVTVYQSCITGNHCSNEVNSAHAATA